MFRKDFKIKSNVLSKNSEKKHIFENISKFYRIDTSILSNLFSKSKLHKIKIECHNNVYSTIYQFDDKPLFFEVSGILVPTIYCLWLMYDFLMTFTIHDETVPYLVKGSDLMIPGIIVSKPINEKSYGTFTKNELVAINTRGNKAPVAVGMTNFDSYDMFMCGGKGKAVNILHVQGDFLWSFGNKSMPPQIDWEVVKDNFEENEVENLAEEVGEVQLEDQLKDNLVEKINDEEFHVEEVIAVDMNEVLLACFLHAVKCSLKDKDLPIILNVFYANHVLRFCPNHVEFDIKKTRHKKFGVFIREMEKEGVIGLANLGKGIEAIKSVERGHERLRFSPSLVWREAQREDQSDVRSYVFPRVEEVYFVTEKSSQLLQFDGYSKGDTIGAAKVREVVTGYVRRNDLQTMTKDAVQLDTLLRSVLLTSKEAGLAQLAWKPLFDRLYKQMTPGVSLVFPGETVTLRNTKTPRIKMEATNKNNKMITRLEGVDVFQIDVRQLCTTIQQAIGCSCSEVTNRSGVTAIQAQGDQRHRIAAILRDQYHVPNNFIDGLPVGKAK